MGAQVIFSDDFSQDGPIDEARWNFNVWTQDDNKSFYGRTQQRQELPSAAGGVLRLRLDSYNESDNGHSTFLGSEAITQETFDLAGGPLAFEAQLRYAQAQRGIIGGFFTFAGPADSHDEIDFEAMSNNFQKMQTNIYHDEPLGEGHPVSYPLSTSLGEFHTYRIEWHADKVVWLIDGTPVRTEPARVPAKAMAMHFNIWAPPAGWPTGDASLVPAAGEGQNQSFFLEVKKVKVERLA